VLYVISSFSISTPYWPWKPLLSSGLPDIVKPRYKKTASFPGDLSCNCNHSVDYNGSLGCTLRNIEHPESKAMSCSHWEELLLSLSSQMSIMFYLASSIRYWPCVCFSGCPTFVKKWNTDVFSICILCPINPPLSHYSTYKVFRDLTPNASTQNQRSSSALICALICVPPLSCNTTLIRDILHQVVKSYRIIVSHIYILKAISSWYIWSLGYILGYIHTRAIINIEMIREDMRVIDHPADRPMWR